MSSAGPSSSPQQEAVVGVFDSGVGGLSVLRAVRSQLPTAKLLYVADSGHAPYGERSDEFILQRTQQVARYLLEQGATLLVLACNTATAVAADQLRACWPSTPLVAVEPGIKPAVAATRNGRIGVMATPATLRSARVQKLLTSHAADGTTLVLQPCPGLAGMIEQHDAEHPALIELVAALCEPLKQAAVDTVVLGCTHYPFLAATIQSTLGAQVQLIDVGAAVARQVARLLGSRNLQEPNGEAVVRLETTGDVERLQYIARHWLPFACEVGQARGLVQ
jgi:glutamate racemase